MKGVVVVVLSIVWLLLCLLAFCSTYRLVWLHKRRLVLVAVAGLLGGVLTQIVGWSGWMLLVIGGVVAADMVEVIPGSVSSPLERSVLTRLLIVSLVIVLAMSVRFLVFSSHTGVY